MILVLIIVYRGGQSLSPVIRSSCAMCYWWMRIQNSAFLLTL